MRFFISLWSLLFLVLPFLGAQQAIQGVVRNTEGEVLAFVNILLNGDPHQGVASDIDGRFALEEARAGDSLVFSYLGYQRLAIGISLQDFSRTLKITLKEKAYGLAQAEVIAGENPAHRIIREAVRQRPSHNPEKLKAYRCQTYNKLVFDWMPNEEGFASARENGSTGSRYQKLRLNRFEVLNDLNKKQHALLMESLTQRDFLKPQHLQETVLHHRVSGFKNPSFVALANSVQPFSCYQNHISLLGKDFLNPISKGSIQHYFFNIEDTLFQAPDTIYILSFHPRKGTRFEGLKGVLYIHTKGYAIQAIIAEPAVPGLMKMKIEQRYQLVEGRQWFPDQLNFELLAEHYPDKYIGLKINGRSYIREVELNPDLKLRHFGMEGISTAPNAENRNDSLWQKIRLEALSPREGRTYAYMDSLGQRRKFDTVLGITETLITGGIPLGPVDIQLKRLLGFNDFEGTRLGLGLRTNKKISRHFTLGGYAGYGLKDQQWKYGGFGKLHLFPRREVNIGFEYQKDIDEPGRRNYALRGSPFTSRAYALRMDNVERYVANLEGWFLPYTFFNFSLEKSLWEPNYDYAYTRFGTEQKHPFFFTELTCRMRYSHGEKFTRFLGSRIREEGRFPILQVTYTRGLNGFWQGQHDYHRLLVSLEYEFNYRVLGETYIRLEGGWASPQAPYQKLYGTNGLGRDFRFLFDERTFHTMDPYEFLSDRFVELFFRHNFKAIFGKWKFIHPELLIVHNLSFGTLSEAENHRDISFDTLENGYYEAGIILEDLVGLNYFNVGIIGLGIGAFYRYGPYSRPAFQDNVGIQATLSFDIL